MVFTTDTRIIPGEGLSSATREALGKLREILTEPAGIVVAYSGGMDSGFLTLAAKRYRDGKNVRAFFVASELIPGVEVERAFCLAEEFELPVERLDVKVLDLHAFKDHPPDRCYHCKLAIFTQILARVPPGWILCEGTNLDDQGDYRPGKKALAELNVASPLEKAGFDKARIREVLEACGAGAFVRPAQPCLATRIPFETPVDETKLRQIAEGEAILVRVGLPGARLRHHGQIARIEVPPADLARALGLVKQCAEALRGLGFKFITLDVDGYRQGSMNP